VVSTLARITRKNRFQNVPFEMQLAPLRHGIPVEVVNRARQLALEFQSFVTKTNALRKVFISVKGIYYQVGLFTSSSVCSYEVAGNQPPGVNPCNYEVRNWFQSFATFECNLYRYHQASIYGQEVTWWGSAS
jgi:hypothetical protein